MTAVIDGRNAPALERLPVGPDTAQWSVWSTTARLVLTDPAALAEARADVERFLAEVDLACSRFRADSELRRLEQAGPIVGRTVTPLLADLLGAALDAARRTDGDVDPTVGMALCDLGYDRDLALVRAYPRSGATVRFVLTSAPDWRAVHLVDRELTVPAGVRLDLGATAKAYTADHCARLIADRYGIGALVSLGGDIATAGAEPAGGWRVLVQDGPGEPGGTVALSHGTAIATSSTLHRRWRTDAQTLHHILDPRTRRPAVQVWRTVTVAAGDCLSANVLSTAAVVRGEAAVPWLRNQGVPARLVRASGDVLAVGGWPA